eukprot:CAMPEP_0175107576 /NCGR_PEP_ID=MMETSP0086_2-20121207/12011_1 /TAXON_ID=136419 /ORGANISM="Unknown Unknown, Strain D1" /LENGTH=34 /DNA_ID= /DNA_START= /DNA_END= /DNA_ORIENTATION=
MAFGNGENVGKRIASICTWMEMGGSKHNNFPKLA